MIEYVKSSQPNRIGIKSPYNGDFVKELKKLVPSARWNGSAWFFDEVSKPDVEKLVNKYYPSADNLRRVRIEWDELRRDNPQIDGTNLAYVTRDYWKWQSSNSFQLRVIECKLSSGGSRKNPGLFGKLVIEAMVRQDADISPSPDNLVYLDETIEPNVDDLIKEMIVELEDKPELKEKFEAIIKMLR